MLPSVVRSRRLASLALTTALLAAGCGQAASSVGSPSGPVATTLVTASATPVATPSASTPDPTASPVPPGPPVTDLGDRLKATIDGVVKPCAMATTDNAVWVTGNSPSMLARIDPTSDEIVSQTPTAGSPCGIAVGPNGRLWIALLNAGQVVAVDPDTGKIDTTIDGLGANLWDLKAGLGSIWVVDRTNREVLRINPRKGSIVAHIAIGPSGSGLAIAGDAVWVVDDIDGSVRRIDPATNTVETTIELDRGASWFADDGHDLLVANRLDGSIARLDVADPVVPAPIIGATSPLDGTVADGRAYIPDSTGTLVEVDLATGSITAVDRLPDATNPFVAEPAFGDIWVLDYGGQRIWRISP
jgi:streptogramin lyase